MSLSKESYFKQIDLIKENYCIGCGVCTTTNCTSLFLDEFGKYKLLINSSIETEIKDVLEICPFSSLSPNEDTLGKTLFSSGNKKKYDSIGYYLNNYVGHVKADKIRLNSSSGGITTWLLTKLLNNGDITHAVHIGQSNKESLLFEYTISEDKESIIAGASSRYYPVEMSSVLKYIKQYDGEYAIVALPCFAKGLRLLQQKDGIFKQRIKYIISPICGHLKTKNYANILAWQKGILAYELQSINFRKKFPDKPASQYGTEFIIDEKGKQKKITYRNSSFRFGTDWGHGMFKYPACDYCDDVVGELADISVGDAWLPKYIEDYKGNSVIVVRNNYLNEVLNSEVAKEELKLDKVSTKLVENSQAGGIRNKREDIKYRLWLKRQNGEWYPPKRVEASENGVDNKRKEIIKLRLRISQYSHELFNESLQKNDLGDFYKKMTPLLDRYFLINFGIIRFLKRKVKQIL